MRYDGAYKESVRSSISSAIKKLAKCIVDASNIPSIPSDFEKIQDINNVITGIQNIKLDDINSAIESIIEDSEGAEEKAVEEAKNLLDYLNIGNKWTGMLNALNTKTATSQKVANIQLKKEQDRIAQETAEVQERTQASIKNGCVALYIGTIKMGENAEDFLISRLAEMKAASIRQIYRADKRSKEMFGEQAEEEAQKVEKEAMIAVEKDRTQEYANELYEKNLELQEIDEKAYAPFKRTGAGYKVIEGMAPIGAATVISIVAPEVASVAVPLIIGTNSAGGATEEYLHIKRYNSKEGIIQSKNNGEINKDQYDFYEFIWNLLDDEDMERLFKSNNLTEEEKEEILRISNMDEKWTTTENLTKANRYGEAIGLMDGLQYLIGGEMLKFNPTENVIVNSSIRMGLDTAFNASDIPYRAVLYWALNEDTDFETAFELMGGMDAVKTNATIALIGSAFGEVYTGIRSKITNVASDSNVSIIQDEKVKIAQEKGDAYLREKGILWMKKGKKQLKDVVIFETDEAFETARLYWNDRTPETVKYVNAFEYNGVAYLRPNSDIVTIIHEGNHVIGYVNLDKQGLAKMRIDNVKEMRGINEAFTESIALRMKAIEGSGNSAYSFNVEILNEYIKILNEHGYADIDLYTYYGSDKTLFGEALNEISGDKYFYYKLVDNMDYADGCSYRSTDTSKATDVNMSRELLIRQLENFKAKINQI